MRRLLAPAMAVVAIVTSASPALGLLLWTLTGTPLTASSGVATTFFLTATNLDLLTELGCLEVDLPESFDIVDASAGNASNGDEWEAVVFSNKVVAHSLNGGGRLELGQSITFTITAIPTQPGAWTWPNHAHREQDCSEAEEIGVALAVFVVPGPTPAPTPTPTPTPRPTPTPTPILPIDPLPTPPLDPLPSILPTLPPLPSIRLPTPVPTARPAESPTASPSPTSSPSPAENVAATPGGTSGSPSGSAPVGTSAQSVRLAVGEPAGSEGSRGGVGDVDLGPLGVIDGITVWAIPGAIVGGPGLLVILWVLLQTGVALAWIPAVRRMRGKDAGRPAAFSGRRTVAP